MTKPRNSQSRSRCLFLLPLESAATGSILQVPETPTKVVSGFRSSQESYKQLTPKGKLRKADIGSPTDFKHLAHVGWSSVPGLDNGSDAEADLKRLFALAGITNDHLRDRQMSLRISKVIEKKGGIEAVRKETQRLKTLEKPKTRYRLRSRSSSSLTPKKALLQSPLATKTTVVHSAVSLSSLRSPPSLPTSPLINFPKIGPLPLSCSEAWSPSLDLVKAHKPSKCYPPLPLKPIFNECLQNNMPPQPCFSPLPSGERPELNVPGLPSPLADTTCGNPNDIQDMMFTADVPAPPPLSPFMKPMSENKTAMSRFQRLSQDLCNQNGSKFSNKEKPCQNSQLLLDQIKRGVQLKTVVPSSTRGSVPCSSIVDALMEVIQKRHKAIQSSDEDEHDEWED